MILSTLFFSLFQVKKFVLALDPTAGALDQLSTDQKCPHMKISVQCREYAFNIFDDDGKFLYSSKLSGTDYFDCYDPSKCYLIEITSTSGDCEFEVSLDENNSIQGVSKYNPNDSGEIFHVGSCTNKCPGLAEVTLISYFTKGEFEYNIHVLGESESNGFVAEGDAVSFCIDLAKCNAISRKKGYSLYYVLDGDSGEKIDSCGFFYIETFGDCGVECNSDTTVLIEASKKESFSYSVKEDGVEIENRTLLPGETSQICINEDTCVSIEGNGVAKYSLYSFEIYEEGPSNEYLHFGSCVKKCDLRPVLHETNRGKGILSVLSTISDMASLNNFRSDRYKAACWIINDDPLVLNASNKTILQRYVLVLLYLTTKGDEWKTNLGFLGGKKECDWGAIRCIEDYVVRIDLENNKLKGTIGSEIFSLGQLEYFNIDSNFVSGTLPSGISTTKLRTFRIGGNKFSGQLPDDVLESASSFEYFSVERNFFTGSIPQQARNVSSLSEILYEDNLFTGIIPDWIFTAPSLRFVDLHHNNLHGTISENFLRLSNLRKLLLNGNQFTSTLPSDLFLMSSLQELNLASNRLSGVLPNRISDDNELINLYVSHNQFSGNIPDKFVKFHKMEKFHANDNLFNGSFPMVLKSLDHLKFMRFEDNFLTGTIPFERCEQFTVLTADCSAPYRINCRCCTNCFGLYTTYEDVLPCEALTLHVQYQTSLHDKIFIHVESEMKEQVLYEKQISQTSGLDYKACISPTDCYVINSEGDAVFDVHINDELLFDGVTNPASLSFGFGAGGVTLKDTCDDINILDQNIPPTSWKRQLINTITKFEGLDKFRSNTSIYYQSLKWWLDDIDEVSDENQSASLVQRYILVVFFYATEGLKWARNTNWLSNKNVCEWIGVYCDESSGIVKKIDLSWNNLTGYLPKELGELRGIESINLSFNKIKGSFPKEIVKLRHLKTLNLAENYLDGTIHPEMKFLLSLQDMDLSRNWLTGSIPSEIGVLSHLKYLNLAKNNLAGELPLELGNLINLSELSLEENSLNGKVEMLKTLTGLVQLKLYKNFFTGSLPVFGEVQQKLEVMDLNNNFFSGRVQTEIGEMNSLKEIFLHSNRISGSIPSELGQLKKVVKLTFSYNQMRGKIPNSLNELKNLTLLHLHSNRFYGEADIFAFKIKSYITDCGEVGSAESHIRCKSCSECCDYSNMCVTYEDIWPYREHSVDTSILVIVVTCIFGAIIFSIAVLFSFVSKSLPPLPHDARSIFCEESVMRFLLSSRRLTWIIPCIAVLFQLYLIGIFLDAGCFHDEESAWVYSVKCPSDDLQCMNRSTTNVTGWTAFYGILAFFLLPDFVCGVFLFYDSLRKFDIQGIFASIVLLNITSLSVVASAVYVRASSMSNTDLIKDAVIVLFLNSIDEQFYLIIRLVLPNLIELLEHEISGSTFSKYEIRELPFDSDDSKNDRFSLHEHELSNSSNITDTVAPIASNEKFVTENSHRLDEIERLHKERSDKMERNYRHEISMLEKSFSQEIRKIENKFQEINNQNRDNIQEVKALLKGRSLLSGIKMKKLTF